MKKSLTVETRVSLFGRGFRAGEAALQELDLAVVVGFVFGDMKPLAIIVRRSPAPVFVDGHKPFVVALAKLGKRFLASVLEQIQIVVKIVTLDGFAGGFGKTEVIVCAWLVRVERNRFLILRDGTIDVTLVEQKNP